MARTVRVELAVENALSVQGLVPRFQDFGEDVYRKLREECEISLHEIDHYAGAFHLRGIRKREVRSVVAEVRKILEKHPWLTEVKIYGVPDESGG